MKLEFFTCLLLKPKKKAFFCIPLPPIMNIGKKQLQLLNIHKKTTFIIQNVNP